MPGSVSQAVSSNVWSAISEISDDELRELAEQIFRLYDDSKFAQFGATFVWITATFVSAFALMVLPLNNFVRDGLIIAAAFGAIWPAYRYYEWRKWQIGEKYSRIVDSHPRALEAARLVRDLYRENHPFC